MRIGVGLPTSTPGTPPQILLAWAQQADAGPFSSLGVVDRLAYHNLDPLLALAAAGVVTKRIGLATMILIAPLRNPALLAKQAATLDVLSGGRLTLGVAVGARSDDYEVAGLPATGRGPRLSEQLEIMRDTWEEGRIGPRPVQEAGPRLLIGGASGPSLSRMARFAHGYVHAGGPPRTFASAAARVKAAWREAGRPGRPMLWAMAYFALGEGAAEEGAAYLKHYYAFTGAFAEKIAAGNLTSAAAVRDFMRGYEEAGCDELVLFPTVGRLEQLELLTGVIG
jgi:alkanesulfonate monooxygenase SsuD/methylene tetrahydromethanopterin reductase-like flavin-dependent oxidoreductase (luciferase family)